MNAHVYSVVAVELRDDHRQRGADDGLVEREQEQREQDRAEDLELLALAELQAGGRAGLGDARASCAWAPAGPSSALVA